jgi:hypothetical protein
MTNDLLVALLELEEKLLAARLERDLERYHERERAHEEWKVKNDRRPKI